MTMGKARVTRYIMTLVLLACTCVLPGCSSDTGREAVPRLTQSSLDQLVERFPLYSGSIVVAKNGTITAEANVGTADLETGRSIDDKTLFSVASVGKMFTAVAISQLVESGKLAYDTGVAGLVPELSGRISERVTIDDLLHHRSGIEAVSGVDDGVFNALESNHDYFRLILQSGIGSTGPAEFAYRNENFQILAEIVERASGQSYESYIRKYIADPLGMTGPIYTRRDRAGSLPIATPYMAVDDETWWNSEEPIAANEPGEFVHIPPPQTPSGGGGAYASANDLLLFANALQQGSLISPASFEEMCSLSDARATAGRGYSRGCAISKDEKGRRIGHTGSAAGIQARFFMYPDYDVVVIVLSNRDEQAAPVFAAIEKLMFIS